MATDVSSSAVLRMWPSRATSTLQQWPLRSTTIWPSPLVSPTLACDTLQSRPSVPGTRAQSNIHLPMYHVYKGKKTRLRNIPVCVHAGRSLLGPLRRYLTALQRAAVKHRSTRERRSTVTCRSWTHYGFRVRRVGKAIFQEASTQCYAAGRVKRTIIRHVDHHLAVMVSAQVPADERIDEQSPYKTGRPRRPTTPQANGACLENVLADGAAIPAQCHSQTRRSCVGSLPVRLVYARLGQECV